MAPSASELTEAIVEALQSPQIREGLLDAVIRPAVDEAVKRAVAANNEEIARLVQQQAEQQAKIDGLEAQVTKLTALVTEQAQCLNELDQYGRKGCVIVSGLPEQANESVGEKIEELGRVVGVGLHGEIDVAHRLGRLAPGRARPIIVRLRSFEKRQELYAARRKLRSTGLVPSALITSAVASKIFISDSLTKTNQDILYRGRQLKKDGRLWAVWSDAGKLKAKAHDGDPTTVIRSFADLARLVGDDPVPPPSSAGAAAAAGGSGSGGAAAVGGREDADDGFTLVDTGSRRPRREASVRKRGGAAR
ncbi:hypothetical protein FJT64_004378 [Amphibalanus amphitrite]|uniref:Uncharacterized protein n=1 Tax=Amphibalanus amphitrite TaxID=1232801 RepID=A0A6A4W8L8_AMPAM|nr:hypothetical protein FJT64_004378 [Amphibalanus amphitrite]